MKKENEILKIGIRKLLKGARKRKSNLYSVRLSPITLEAISYIRERYMKKAKMSEIIKGSIMHTFSYLIAAEAQKKALLVAKGILASGYLWEVIEKTMTPKELKNPKKMLDFVRRVREKIEKLKYR